MKSLAPILLASSALLSVATAQVYPPIDPEDFDIETRTTWCNEQQSMCPAICADQEHVGAREDGNTCDPETLEYQCICENNKSPNMTEYSLTMPYELCRQSIVKCRDNCNGDPACANLCDTGKQCGATNPTRVNATTTTGSPGASKTSSSPSSTNTDGSDDDDGTDDFTQNGIATRMANSGAFGMVLTVAAGFAFFGLM